MGPSPSRPPTSAPLDIPRPHLLQSQSHSTILQSSRPVLPRCDPESTQKNVLPPFQAHLPNHQTNLRLGLTDLPIPIMPGFTGPLTAPISPSAGFNLAPPGASSSQTLGPAMSPLDVLALHSRRLAQRFDEPIRTGRADRPLSRLAPAEVADELGRSQSHHRQGGGHPGLIRAISPGPASPRSPVSLPVLERPVSHYPQFGSVDDLASLDSLEDDFSIPRANSPEEMGPDDMSSIPPSNRTVHLSRSGSDSGSSMGASLGLHFDLEAGRFHQLSCSLAGPSPTSLASLRVPTLTAPHSRRTSPVPSSSLSRAISPLTSSSSRTISPTPDSPTARSASGSAISNRPRGALNFSKPRSAVPSNIVAAACHLSLPDRQLSADSIVSKLSLDRCPSRQDTGEQPATPLSTEAAIPFVVSPSGLHDLHLPALSSVAGPSSHKLVPPPSVTGVKDEDQAPTSFVYSSFRIPKAHIDRVSLTPSEFMGREFDWELTGAPRASTLGVGLDISLREKKTLDGPGPLPAERTQSRPTSPLHKDGRPSTAGRQQRKLQKQRAAPTFDVETRPSDNPRAESPKNAAQITDRPVPALLRPPSSSARRAASSSGPPSSPPTPPKSNCCADVSDRPLTSNDHAAKHRPGIPASDPVSPETHLEKGIGHHERGDLAKATYHWRLGAQGGHPTAMLLYAIACRHGWGMKPSPSEGIRWLQLAVDSAQLEVADDEDLVKRGGTTNFSSVKTHKAQFALSVYELGVSYMNGWGVKQNRSLAVRCFEVAGNWGDGDALCEAAKCYAEGIGVRKKDLHKAARLYRQAEERGIFVAGNSWIHKEKYNDEPSSLSGNGAASKKWFRIGESN